MTNNPIVPPQDQHDDLFQRLIWTGTAVNGASFLALSNIVANAPNQDSALAALTIPMFLLGSGLIVGGSAIWHLLYMRALRMNEAIFFQKSMNAMDRSKLIKPAVAEMPMPLELAKIVYGGQAENEILLLQECSRCPYERKCRGRRRFQIRSDKIERANYRDIQSQ